MKGNQRFVYLYDLAESLNDLGLIYISNGQMLEAQKAFQETLAIHKNIHSGRGALASAHNNIAYLNHQIGQYSEAWHEYALALEDAKAANLSRVQIAILNGRGDLLTDVGEIEEAKETYQQALTLGEHTETVESLSGLAKAERAKATSMRL